MQVYVSKDQRQWGPYEATHVPSLIECGSFTLEDWAWVEGQTEWVPLARVQQTLLEEEAAKAAVVHQRVEQARGKWRRKLTTPLPSSNKPHRMDQRKDGTSPEQAKKAAWKRPILPAVLVVGLAVLLGWYFWGGAVADYNSLFLEEGIVYQSDAEEPFEGTAAMRDAKGKVLYKANYRKGRLHGKFVSFYDGGAKESEGRMKEGQLHGKVVYYYPDGKKKSRYEYENGTATSRENWDAMGKEITRGP
jgi:hypothetical protein